MIAKLTRDAMLLLATIDPVGTVAIFAAVTVGMPGAQRRRIAMRATAYAAAILVGAVLLGQIVLQALGVRLISLEVAGGVVLFLFGLQMIFGSKFRAADSQPESGHEVAVFPLAIPSIASPGAIMAAIVATDNDLFSPGQQVLTSLVLLAVLGLTLVMMLLADRILRFIGKHGSEILIRVMGMLLAALSVELVMEALGIQRWLSDGH